MGARYGQNQGLVKVTLLDLEKFSRAEGHECITWVFTVRSCRLSCHEVPEEAKHSMVL